MYFILYITEAGRRTNRSDKLSGQTNYDIRQTVTFDKVPDHSKYQIKQTSISNNLEN